MKPQLIPKGYWILSNTRKAPKGWKVREDLAEYAKEAMSQLMQNPSDDPHAYNGTIIYYIENGEGTFILEKE